MAGHHVDRRPLHHVADVGAAGEDLVAAGQNDAARHLVASEGAEVLGQTLAHGEIEGVAHLRPVEPHHGDRLGGTFQQHLAHDRSFRVGSGAT